MVNTLSNDEQAAATELGYIFTFLLGVLLLTAFGIWAFDIETSTRDRWNETVVSQNMDLLADAIERADEASRLDSGVKYAESVKWSQSEEDERSMTLKLTELGLELEHRGGALDQTRSISGTGTGSHEGEFSLGGVEQIWIIHEDGATKISIAHPGF